MVTASGFNVTIEQGDVFWVNLPAPVGSEAGFRRPAVVIQANRMNRSALRTVVVCPITSTLAHANAPGNVLLAKGEANLSRRSVVIVSGIVAIDRFFIQEKIGTLARSRMRDVLAGLMILVAPD